MNGLDFLILVLGGLSLVYGLFRGALRMVTSAVSLVAAIYVASLYYETVGAAAERMLSVNPTVGAAIGFAVVFAAIFVAVEIAGGFVSRLVHTIHLGVLDRLAGGVFGFAIGMTVAGLVVMGLAAALPSDAAILRDSELAPEVLGYTERVISFVPAEIRDSYAQKRSDLYRFWIERAAGGPSASPTPH
jgi:membrane protein required for colicin V production